jgi:hypothetical protein
MQSQIEKKGRERGLRGPVRQDESVHVGAGKEREKFGESAEKVGTSGCISSDRGGRGPKVAGQEMKSRVGTAKFIKEWGKGQQESTRNSNKERSNGRRGTQTRSACLASPDTPRRPARNAPI